MRAANGPGLAGADAVARVAKRQRSTGRVTARRLRYAWPAGYAAAIVLLFFACLRLAGTLPVISDGANNALQAWQMLHGNLLLHGWWMTDVSFYTTELPQYMLVEAVAGLRPEVVHICAALTYTLLVLLAALVARGRARGAEGAVRALLAAGIMFAPTPGSATVVLLSSPDHVGTAVPVLLLMLLLEWAPRRWYVPVAAGVLLAWGVVADPLVLVVGVLPVLAVCLGRAVLALPGRRVLWYELSLACAAGLAVPAAAAVNRLVVALGGFNVSKNPASVIPLSALPANVAMTARSVLALFGADAAGTRGGLNQAFAFIHLAGVTLVLAAVALACWRLAASLRLRGAGGSGGAGGAARPLDMVADLMVVAIAANIAAYFVLYRITYIFAAHEIGPVVALGAALAGRLLGGPLLRVRLVPALAAGLACYAVILGFGAAGKQVPPANAAVTAWLAQHGLRSGIAPYWESSSVTLDSGGTITMGTVKPARRGLAPWQWMEDMRIFRPGHTADFFLTLSGESVTPAMARAAFGPPARVYHYQAYTIMVWDKNLLPELGRPIP
jgi:hypothetical protein